MNAEKTWFAVTWESGDAALAGPFGDDRDAAVAYARAHAGEGERAVVQLEIEPV